MSAIDPILSNIDVPKVDREKQNLRTKVHELRAKLEAAGGDEFNTRLWANADSLGPNAAFSDTVRSRVRDRGRYEHLNGNYARGLVRDHAYDLIGACPKPQLTIPGDDSGDIAAGIERSWQQWAKEVRLGHTCRLMEKCRGHSGEAFAYTADNPALRHPIKMAVRQFEPEQCVSPWDQKLAANTIDGIRFDEFGNRAEYFVLRYHPGELNDLGIGRGESDFLRLPANRVFHWFEQDRPGQIRGIPRISASLPLFSQVRRWNLATLTAAEFAAMLAGIMYTNMPAADGQPTTIDNWNFFELVKGALLSLPSGWDAKQFKAEQPTTSHAEYKREQLNEAGRGSGAPLNVVTGNSSGYNYSSGRLDHVPYQRGKRIDRYDFQNVFLEPLLLLWVAEARMIGLIDASVPPIEEWGIAWNYDGFGSIDEQKDANTDDMRLGNGTATLQEIYAEYGQDSREQFRRLVAEVKMFEAEGLVHPFVAKNTATPQPAAAQPTNDQPADPNAEARLMAALLDNGVPEGIAEQVAAEFFSQFRARHKPSRNGHAHPIGGRA